MEAASVSDLFINATRTQQQGNNVRGQSKDNREKERERSNGKRDNYSKERKRRDGNYESRSRKRTRHIILTGTLGKGHDLIAGRTKTVMMAGRIKTVMGGIIRETARIEDRMVGTEQDAAHKEKGEIRSGIKEDLIREVSLETRKPSKITRLREMWV